VNVTTRPGSEWTFNGQNTEGRSPTVNGSGGSLSIDSTVDGERRFLGGGRDTWDVSLPTSEIEELSVVVNAGHADVTLSDARLRRLAITANASAVVVDASAASVADVSAETSFGSLALTLPADRNVSGAIRVAAGAVRVCAPPEVGLRLRHENFAGGFTVNGVHEAGTEWTSPSYPSATHRSELNVSVTFGSVEINPIGGCK
jgi:hypothetical protein